MGAKRLSGSFVGRNTWPRGSSAKWPRAGREARAGCRAASQPLTLSLCRFRRRRKETH